jgi:hypothetical protein
MTHKCYTKTANIDVQTLTRLNLMLMTTMTAIIKISGREVLPNGLQLVMVALYSRAFVERVVCFNSL